MWRSSNVGNGSNNNDDNENGVENAPKAFVIYKLNSICFLLLLTTLYTFHTRTHTALSFISQYEVNSSTYLVLISHVQEPIGKRLPSS